MKRGISSINRPGLDESLVAEYGVRKCVRCCPSLLAYLPLGSFSRAWANLQLSPRYTTYRNSSVRHRGCCCRSLNLCAMILKVFTPFPQIVVHACTVVLKTFVDSPLCTPKPNQTRLLPFCLIYGFRTGHGQPRPEGRLFGPCRPRGRYLPRNPR